MSIWLVKYYPVAPAQELKIYNLDVLNCDDYCSKAYQELVKSELEEYELGLSRDSIDTFGYVHYNNKNMKIVSAGDIKGVLTDICLNG